MTSKLTLESIKTQTFNKRPNMRFVFVFTVFGGHRPFHKKQQNEKFVIKIGDVFREGCRHHFFIDFGRFWPPFWEGFGRPNRKKQVSERSEKTAGPGAAPDEPQDHAGAPKSPQEPPEAPGNRCQNPSRP